MIVNLQMSMILIFFFEKDPDSYLSGHVDFLKEELPRERFKNIPHIMTRPSHNISPHGRVPKIDRVIKVGMESKCFDTLLK